MSEEAIKRTTALNEEILRVSSDMSVQPDANGELIPTFEEWLKSLRKDLMPLFLSDENFLKLLRAIYSTTIYNCAVPSKNPLVEFRKILDNKTEEINTRMADFKAGNIPNLRETVAGSGIFIGTDGEFYGESIFKRVLDEINSHKGMLSKLMEYLKT